jgi:phage/plasmid-associated DNA primase
LFQNGVKSATSDYQGEEDELGEFISERCVLASNEVTVRSELHCDYLRWAQSRGTKVPLKSKTFNKRMRSREGIKEGKSGVWLWRGIGLKRDLHEPTAYQTPGVHHFDFSQAGRAA